MRRRRPWLSTAEVAFFFLCSTLCNLPVTSSIVRSFTSSNVSIKIVTCSRWSGVTCSIFFTISVSLMLPPRVVMLLASLVIHIEKSSMDSPSLKRIYESSFCSCSMLDSRTRCTPIRRDLIPSLADCAVHLVERDASISGGTNLNMATNASWSSQYSIVSPSSSSTACHNPCACRLTRTNKAFSL